MYRHKQIKLSLSLYLSLYIYMYIYIYIYIEREICTHTHEVLAPRAAVPDHRVHAPRLHGARHHVQVGVDAPEFVF